MNSELWKKYGLSMSLVDGLGSDAGLYDALVATCHDKVCEYLEENPEYPWGSPGHMYFDVIKLCAGRFMDEACDILDRHGMLYHPTVN